MSKDIDDRGILRPEHTMTEAQIRSHMFNNEKKIISENINETVPKADLKFLVKEKLNNSLNQMQSDVLTNMISLETFEKYYILIEYGISSRILDNFLTFVLTLSDAKVLIKTDSEEEKYSTYKKKLENMIANEIRKLLGTDILILESRLNRMIKTLNQYVVKLKEYYDFCEILQCAMMAKIEGINYLECAQALQKAKIEAPRAYHEYIKLHNYQNKVASIIIQLEQQEKNKSIK